MIEESVLAQFKFNFFSKFSFEQNKNHKISLTLSSSQQLECVDGFNATEKWF